MDSNLIFIFGEEKLLSIQLVLALKFVIRILKGISNSYIVYNDKDLIMIKVVLKFFEYLDDVCGFEFGSYIIFFY